MYCPRCGQGQTHDQTKFCSRCGFLMEGIVEVVRNGGLPVSVRAGADPNAVSPKKRGLKQGGIMILSGMIIVPILAIMLEMFNVEPILAAVAAVTLFWGGILRMVYALIFQTGKPTSHENSGFFSSIKQTFMGAGEIQKTLPAAPPQSANHGFEQGGFNWRDTDDLQEVPGQGNSTTRFGRQ